MPALAPSRQRSPMRDDLRAAAGERAHDRGAAADVGAVADDDARGDAALDHRRAERAGVEVHEALVHDRGAGREVRAEADPVGVGDPHARRARRSRSCAGTCRRRGPSTRPAVAGGAQAQPGGLEAVDRARARRWSTRRSAGRRRCRRGSARAAGPAGATAGAGAGRRRRRRRAARPGRRPCGRRSASRRAAGPRSRARRGRPGRRTVRRSQPGSPSCGSGYQVSRVSPVVGHGGQAHGPCRAAGRRCRGRP